MDSGNIGTITVDVFDPGIKVYIRKKNKTCSTSGHLSVGSSYAVKQ